MRRERPHGADRAERHQQVADPLEPQQQDALRILAATMAHERQRPRHRRQRGVGQAHCRALARIVNAVEVVEHCASAKVDPVNHNTEVAGVVDAQDRPRVPGAAHQLQQGRVLAGRGGGGQVGRDVEREGLWLGPDHHRPERPIVERDGRPSPARPTAGARRPP